MTLVATYSLLGQPVVIGDVMISIKHKGQKHAPFNIPTLRDANSLATKNSDRLVSKLVQKVTIITTRLVLAWAGSEFCARFILREILELENPSFDQVRCILEKWQQESGVDLYITGIFLLEPIDRAIPVVRFAWDSSEGWESNSYTYPNYGQCFIGGSGKDELLKLIQHGAINSSEKFTHEEGAILLSLAHLGKLAGEQMRTGAGIAELFGGAFEIATVIDRQIRKISNVAYHFWEISKTDEEEATISMYASIKIDYFEDYLVVRKIDFVSNDPNQIGADEVYVISPVTRTMTENEKNRLALSITRPTMNSKYSVFYLYFPEKQRADLYTGMARTADTPSETIDFIENDDGSFQINIMGGLTNAIRKMCES